MSSPQLFRVQPMQSYHAAFCKIFINYIFCTWHLIKIYLAEFGSCCWCICVTDTISWFMCDTKDCSLDPGRIFYIVGTEKYQVLLQVNWKKKQRALRKMNKWYWYVTAGYWRLFYWLKIIGYIFIILKVWVLFLLFKERPWSIYK